MICTCGRTVSTRGLAAHMRGADHQARIKELERVRQKAVEERDWAVRKLIYQTTRCRRHVVDAPPELMEAGYMDPGARKVLDDYLLDRGVDVAHPNFQRDLNALDYQMPKGLSELGRRAQELIYDFLYEEGLLYSGGICNVFRTPEEHARMESMVEGLTDAAELVVIHDGGAHAPAFNPSYEDRSLRNALRLRLEEIGCYADQLSSWASAIYSGRLRYQR